MVDWPRITSNDPYKPSRIPLSFEVVLILNFVTLFFSSYLKMFVFLALSSSLHDGTSLSPPPCSSFLCGGGGDSRYL